MYYCINCGNKKYFIEHRCVETEVTLDQSTGEPTGFHDTKSECVEVVCGVCEFTSENGFILDRKTMLPIRL
jgi:hypothetical protein